MLLGNGLLAKMFIEYQEDPSLIIFASGVSNSSDTSQVNFDREKKLLIKTITENKAKKIVYFSSCDVIYANKIDIPYYFHKIEMEKIIQTHAQQYHIFRLPQIIGYSENRNSLLNFFIESIKSQTEIKIFKNAYKSLIDIDDIYNISKYLINNKNSTNKIINIFNPNFYSVQNILYTIEKLLKKEAKVVLLEQGFKPDYLYSELLQETNMTFDEGYLKRSIFKHYKQKLEEN